MNYSDLYTKIGYTFTNVDLLLHALTRTAYARENELSMSETMDSLAVLGDAVLDLIVIRQLIEEGEFDKGEITRKKIDLVNMTVVRRLAEDIGLPEYMRWGKGEITRKKIDLVNMTVVRRLAEDIGLPEYMRWGKGEIRMQIWTSGRVSAECFEALMGAAYLDGGVEASAAILDHLWTPEKP